MNYDGLNISKNYAFPNQIIGFEEALKLTGRSKHTFPEFKKITGLKGVVKNPGSKRERIEFSLYDVQDAIQKYFEIKGGGNVNAAPAYEVVKN